MKEVLSLVHSMGLTFRCKRFFFCLGCSSRQAGQAVELGRLSLIVCVSGSRTYIVNIIEKSNHTRNDFPVLEAILLLMGELCS
jgi:hypothetical protein